jgi:hypothetical protein
VRGDAAGKAKVDTAMKGARGRVVFRAVNAKDLCVSVATDSTSVAYATGVFIIAKYGPPGHSGFLDVRAADRLRDNALPVARRCPLRCDTASAKVISGDHLRPKRASDLRTDTVPSHSI